MSIASKLKDLVIKWGGQPTKDDDSIEEFIALLTELDAPSSGSGGALVVGLRRDQDSGVVTLDKTGAEIMQAQATMPIIFVNVDDENGNQFAGNFLGTFANKGKIYVTFYVIESTDPSSNTITYDVITAIATTPDSYPTFSYDDSSNA